MTASEIMRINTPTTIILTLCLLLGSTAAVALEALEWKTPDYSVAVELPSCEGPDAVHINRAADLELLRQERYRIFCFAPGDYRSAGVQKIESLSGRPGAPRVIRMLDDALQSPAEFARAPLSDIPLLPPIVFRDSHHWVLDRLAFIDIDEARGVFPLRFFAANNIVMNRLRVQSNRHGIEFHHQSRDIVLQNSLIGDMDMDSVRGNDAVCVAFEGRYTDKGKDVEPVSIRNVRVLNNEIYNCNDGVQLIWNEGAEHWPDFSGTLIAANDIYIDERRLTDCRGSLSEDGSCACTENAIDIKAGAKSAANPVLIRHNRFYGWRKTDSVCNKDAHSWGTAISVHFEAAQNLRIEQNIFWDVVSAISLTKRAKNIKIVDNLIHTVPKAGPGNGIAVVSYEGVSGVDISGNRVVDAHGWLSLLSDNTVLSCNIINQSGAAIGRLSDSSFSEKNSYYAHPEQRFVGTGDVRKEHRLASEDAELCTDIYPFSKPSRVCLAFAVSTEKSPHACNNYWRAD